jgi:peptide/nickel transport system ATP-binding protein
MDPLQSSRGRPVLEIKGLATEFPTRSTPFRAVQDVSLTLHQGETLCVVGESGSGKSVMARSVLQIVDAPGRIAAGQILLHRDDETIDIARLHPRSRAIRSIRGRDIAMIFQEPMSSLSPIHRIGDQIGDVLRIHERLSKQEINSRAIELLAQVGIRNPTAAVNRYPFEFSGGMRQRAMIAMALACNPSVLIADEPTTALDVSVQAEILALLKSLQDKTGMAILFITHDMGVVAEIADRIVVMRHGAMVEQGEAATIFDTPQHPYTRSLLAAVRDLDRPSPKRIEMRTVKAPGRLILVAENLRKDFGNATAVSDVSISLKHGENLGIVGESGSGKTTMGRCLQRVYDVTGGSILYTDRNDRTTDLASLPESALRPAWRDIRMIFQDPFSSLNPRMTVGQIIAEPLRNTSKMTPAQIDVRVNDLLQMVALPASAASRYPHAFSGGQRQRISIARALAPDPRIIIADEATSALDVTTRTQILDLMLDLQQQLDLSFILISHDIAVIRYFCDRVAVMHKGEIVETGQTEVVCSAPTHPYTEALLSAIPVSHPNQRGSKQRIRYDG